MFLASSSRCLALLLHSFVISLMLKHTDNLQRFVDKKVKSFLFYAPALTFILQGIYKYANISNADYDLQVGNL